MKRYSFLALILTLSVLTGCLRSAGDSLEGLEARALSTTTPSNTPFTPERIVETVVATIIITATPDPNSTTPPETVIITATEDPLIVAQAQVETTPEPNVQETRQVRQTQQALNTAEAVQAQSDVVAQQATSSNPNIQLATDVIASATAAAANETATALGPQQVLPTFTPTLNPNLAPVPTATLPPAIGGPNCVHEIVRGENLFRLSLRYGVSVADLVRVNNITNQNLVLVGQKITIPNCGTTGAVPPPTSIPTSPPESSFGTGGPATNIPGTVSGIQHVVQQYETLFQISLQYGVSVDAIAAANGITNPNLIIMTDVLTIPR